MRKKTVLNAVSSTIDGKPKRRGFLRGTLAAIGGGVPVLRGLSEKSVAIDRKNADVARKAAKEYTSSEAVRTAVQTHATELLQRLIRDSQVKQEVVGNLPTDQIHRSVESHVDSAAGTFVYATASDEEATVKIQIKRPLPDGRELILVIAPQYGKSQAFFEGEDEENGSTYYTSTTDDGGNVTVQNCDEACGTPTYECGYSCNPYNNCGCTKYKIHDSCTDFDCIGCYAYDYSCCGDYECS
ncbi:hypothetical protein [Halorussus lipolyticus]|uniref:hypothetical protein n=1 Tax=Halorussus lipolyticus TaxID=3034024 RepID=UPI0023E77FB4|nr:hypothetical protein [Halorussus sp. DT80]